MDTKVKYGFSKAQSKNPRFSRNPIPNPVMKVSEFPQILKFLNFSLIYDQNEHRWQCSVYQGHTVTLIDLVYGPLSHYLELEFWIGVFALLK